MSRRTLVSAAGVGTDLHVTSLLPTHRHYTYHASGFSHHHHGYYHHHHQRYPRSTSPSSSSPTSTSVTTSTSTEDATTQLFDGLDDARFDQVRRAVARDRTCLSSTRQRQNRVSTNTKPLTPLAYALANCELWNALAAHCRRTGVAVNQRLSGALTFTERLSAMNIILPWLIHSSDDIEHSSNISLLHTALSCGLHHVVFALLEKAPSLGTTIKNGKSSLHVICGMVKCKGDRDFSVSTHANGTSNNCIPDDVVCRLIHKLCALGCDTRLKDNNHTTPLQELVISRRSRRIVHIPSSTQQQQQEGYGLRRRQQQQNLSQSAAAASLEAAGSVIETLVAHGTGLKDIQLKQITEQEITVLRQSVNNVREKVCGINIMGKWNECNDGSSKVSTVPLWSSLPDEVIDKILSFLSPVEVVTGVAMTCQGLRAQMTRPSVWIHFF